MPLRPQVTLRTSVHHQRLPTLLAEISFLFELQPRIKHRKSAPGFNTQDCLIEVGARTAETTVVRMWGDVCSKLNLLQDWPKCLAEMFCAQAKAFTGKRFKCTRGNSRRHSVRWKCKPLRVQSEL